MSGESNGGGVPSITQEEAAALQREMLEQMAMQIAGQLQSLYPHIPAPAITRAAQMAVGEQPMLYDRVLADVVANGSRVENPRWGLLIRKSNDPPNKAVAQIVVQKDMRNCKSLQAQHELCTVIAYATSPLARASMYLLGYVIDWAQFKAESKIIVPQ